MPPQDISRSSGLLLILVVTTSLNARPNPAEITWQSATTGGAVHGQIYAADSTKTPNSTVVYLKNLSIPRLGREPDDQLIGEFVRSGCIVLVLDYSHHPLAVSANLNADVLKLRQDIADGKKKSLLTEYPVDPNHLYILMEGFRLKRDVEFAREGNRVLAMDVICPANPIKPVPILMEITCDNVNRMGSMSLLFCHDTLLEGAQAAGFAAAMVDHPVAPPYKGIDDPMPQCLDRMKAAVAKLRAMHGECGATESIGAIGFSRGGPFAAMLAGSGDVQAALVHGNRYDYLDLLPSDPMLPRFEKAWGPAQSNRQKWAEHGASRYVTGKAAPMFLNTSDAESPEYRDGLAKLDKLLTSLGIEHVYQVDTDGRGHRVSTDPKTIQSIYSFFSEHLR